MQQLAVPSKCVVFRNGIEIWMPEGEKLDKFQAILGNLQSHMFVNWDGISMNTADITGVFLPEQMEDMKRRKNGEWQCKKGTWHERHTECACRDELKEWQQEQTPEEELAPEQIERNKVAIDEIRSKFGSKRMGA